MRILFISTTFPDADAPTRGTYNTALCRALQERHQVHVVSPRFFQEVHHPFRARKKFRIPADLQQLGITVDYPTSWYTPRILQQHYGDQMWWSVRNTVEKAIYEHRPDAVLSYWAHPDGAVGLRAAEIAGVPAAVIVGGTDVLILPKSRQRGSKVREVLHHSHAVISVSEGLRTTACDLGVAPDRVHTIYQGIDEHVFHTRRSREESRQQLGLPDNFVHLVWVGRMVPVKALPMLLNAAAQLRASQLKFKLHLLGDGPLKESLQHQSAQLGLDSFVHFHGAVGHQRIPDWYRAADLTVLSSDSEGLPNVLRESLACGTPFVSTDVGSLGEIARPEFSRLTPAGNPVAFAEAVQSLLTPEARQAAAAYRARTWTDCADDVGTLLETLREDYRNEVTTPILSCRKTFSKNTHDATVTAAVATRIRPV